MVTRETVYILIEVKHHSNANDQENGKHVCAQELGNQVTVYAFKERDSHASALYRWGKL